MARIEAFEAAAAEGAVPSRVTSEATVAARRRGPTGIRRFARSSLLGTVAVVFLLVVLVMALLADVITYWDPLLTNYGSTRQPPSAEHLLGTDHLGRDLLSRILWGARPVLVIAPLSVLGAAVLGSLRELLRGVH